ncbi:hypothetical protein DYBT9275_05120 [Dyadobacter sp. CECT 9275]|uniref:Uncharacterized protein n=1 Tax=Dyadobacter helix TaxID=2822344 RepID=A0A916JGK9_9BACT|nr:hypothetical protein [Dyadobacter sp. CECT 9275]CAG5012163.1 hypothetical protein DYBT9275_05120 [Dyadobacter sp. CECT 9275]
MDGNEGSGWQPYYQFAVHIIVASLIFVLIALAAVGLGYFVHYLEEKKTSAFIIYTLTFVEYLIFIIDVFLYLLQIIEHSLKTGKKLWKQIIS